MMLDLDQVAARVRSQVSAFKVVGTSADLDAALASPIAPAAYVIPLAERAGAPILVGTYEQEVEQAFGVVLVVANLRDNTGGASVTDLRTLRQQLRAALMGWVADPAEGFQARYTGGCLLRWADQRLWWTDEWSVATWARVG